MKWVKVSNLSEHTYATHDVQNIFYVYVCAQFTENSIDYRCLMVLPSPMIVVIKNFYRKKPFVICYFRKSVCENSFFNRLIFWCHFTYNNPTNQVSEFIRIFIFFFTILMSMSHIIQKHVIKWHQLRIKQ